MHWADVIAEGIEKKHKQPLVSAGISPTGEIHVGSLREARTSESIRSTLESRGSDVRMLYFIDSMDPLRRRYEFLPESFEAYAGMPIYSFPCPCGKHDSYAHHYVQPFLDAADALGVKCEIIWTHKLYEEGKFAETIDAAFLKRDQVIKILREVTARAVPDNYAPYQPLCSNCNRFTDPVFSSYSYPKVRYKCKCGHEGVADITKGEGKLAWRLEWPAKWKAFGVSVEPFGKDHASAGGSYESGERIVREIFGGEAPYPVPYEFVQLKGIGQMHKSTGSAVSGIDAINITPPEVLNYIFLRVNPERHIDYDSGAGVMDICDEYDRMETCYFTKEFTEAEANSVRADEIAQHNAIPDVKPATIPFKHLVNVVQMADGMDSILDILKRTGKFNDPSDADIKRLKHRVDCARYWLDGFAPDNVKFSICKTMPSVELSDDEKGYLRSLAARFGPAGWNAEEIHNIISEESKKYPFGMKGGFQALYKVLIGRTSGPRLGHFLEAMDKEFVVKRLNLG
jgi:lysyl-tRNA synthetase class 1